MASKFRFFGYFLYDTQNISKNEADKFLLECQNGFRKGHSCSDASYTVKFIIEKRVEHNEETHIVDFEKTYDRVNRTELLSVLDVNRP